MRGRVWPPLFGGDVRSRRRVGVTICDRSVRLFPTNVGNFSGALTVHRPHGEGSLP